METLVEGNVKFVVNSRTFDTATSRVAAVHRGQTTINEVDSLRYEHVLYRTAKGAFFLHRHNTVKHPRGKPVTEDGAEELTPSQASDWIQSTHAVIHDASGLTLPDEA